jgi:hypothetical protein
MKRIFMLFGGLISFLLLNGCASIITQTTQRVTIEAEPKDSKILIDGAIFQSPGSTQLERGIYASNKHVIRVEKDEYVPCEFKTRDRFNAWFIGNCLLGGIIGMIIDLATGASAWVQEETSFVILNKDKPCDVYFKINDSQKDWFKYKVENPHPTWDEETFYRDTDGSWKAKIQKTVADNKKQPPSSGTVFLEGWQMLSAGNSTNVVIEKRTHSEILISYPSGLMKGTSPDAVMYSGEWHGKGRWGRWEIRFSSQDEATGWSDNSGLGEKFPMSLKKKE